EVYMTREYSALELSPLSAGARVCEPPLPRVGLDDPAISVMTDLRQVPAATTTSDEPIDEANRVMIRRGVRLLFVIDREGAVEGVITATDLLGEKPVRFMR